MPTPVSVRRYGLFPRPTLNIRAPGQFVVAGSLDGTTWTLVDQHIATSSQYVDNTETFFTVTTTPKTYTYFRLIATTLAGTSTGATSLDIGQWTLYGFEPPLTFMNVPSASSPQAIVGGVAPAYEQNLVPASGYTATASTTVSGNVPSRLFDRAQTTRWASALSTYANGGGGAIYIGSVSTTVAGLGNVLGEWAQIQLPAPARLTRYAFYPSIGLTSRSPVDFVVVGSNDGSTWDVVDQVVYSGFTYTNYKPTAFIPRSSTQSFSTYRLIVQKLFVNGLLVDIAEWDLFGIYDAPLPAQSLVPNMLAAQHGWYRASASSIYGAGYDAYLAFDGVTTNRYLSAVGVFVTATGTYTGTVTTSTNLGAVAGEYLDIACPNGVVPSRIDLMPQTDFRERSPRKFTVVGSNDTGATWTVLAQFSDIALATYTNLAYTTFTLPTITQPYKTLRLIIEEVFNTNLCAFTEVQYYGYEQPTFITSASTHTTNAAVALVPPGFLGNGYLAAPPGSALSEVIGIAIALDSPPDHFTTGLRAALVSNV
jgi:hypothetical protein